MPEQKKFLNLGCGDRYLNDWENVDFVSTNKNVQAWNLTKGIPYPDNTFDVVYHSHVLEHFIKTDAERFIAECYRVLKPSGIIRIAVPNLEIIAKNYLKFLELAISNDKTAEANYDWMMLEMYDQTVRTYGGGEMKKYFKQEKMINAGFVKSRMGHFFEIMTAKKSRQKESRWKKQIKKLISPYIIKNFFKKWKKKMTCGEYKELGKFRMSGEIHQWMYDRFSLSRLLKNVGFKQIIQRSASESYISDWEKCNLDTEPDGTVYKPDSLFMEAKK